MVNARLARRRTLFRSGETLQQSLSGNSCGQIVVAA
jgi:hypothetical protein